jgi:DNA-binding transcriptional MerR regulator
MKIGEAARLAGVSTKAIRYYESLGLLVAERQANGYREYGDEHVRLIREIHALTELGIRVDQSRPFLDCIDSGGARGDDCSASLDAYRATISQLDARIAELSARRETLAALLQSASARTEALCEFSENLLTERA